MPTGQRFRAEETRRLKRERRRPRIPQGISLLLLRRIDNSRRRPALPVLRDLLRYNLKTVRRLPSEGAFQQTVGIQFRPPLGGQVP